MKRLLTWIIVVWCLFLKAQAQAASFDCGKATTDVEKLICGDAGLSKLDEEMEKTYSEALKKFSVPKALKLRQKQWLKRRDACVKEEVPKYITQCLKEIYQQRLVEIMSLIMSDPPCPELPLIKREEEKAQCLKRWLARHPLELRKEHIAENDRQFCTNFYQALATASSEITYVQPVLRTEDPEHPDLSSYRKCHDYQPIGLGYDYQGLDMQAHGFRLYRLDLDGNPKNGLEEYLYEEESLGSVKNGTTQYVRVAFGEDRCDIKDTAHVYPQEGRRLQPNSFLQQDEMRIIAKLHNEYGLNALIAFRGRYYIVDLSGYMMMSTTGYDSKSQTFSTYQCAWFIPEHFLNDKNNENGAKP